MTNMTNSDILLINQTGYPLDIVHDAIIKAIRNGGTLGEDLADVLTLERTTRNHYANLTDRQAWVVGVPE